jgi:hypothetical protein
MYHETGRTNTLPNVDIISDNYWGVLNSEVSIPRQVIYLTTPHYPETASHYQHHDHDVS